MWLAPIVWRRCGFDQGMTPEPLLNSA